MGGEYPSGREYNFFGDNSSLAAHVVHTWPTNITFSGNELGSQVLSGALLSTKGLENDPVRAAYNWYAGFNSSRFSWDPLTMLYACNGLGSVFEYAVDFGYNHVFENGSNAWVFEEGYKKQRWLKLKVDNETAGKMLDELFLSGTESIQ